MRIDLFTQWHRLQKRTHTKDPDLQQPGEMPVFDSIRTRGNIYVAGAAVGLDL